MNVGIDNCKALSWKILFCILLNLIQIVDKIEILTQFEQKPDFITCDIWYEILLKRPVNVGMDDCKRFIYFI